MKDLISKIDKEKTIKYGAVAAAAISILYVVYYYFSHCFSVSKSFGYNFYFIVIAALIIGPTVYLARILFKGLNFSYTRLYLVLAICWGIAMQLVMPPISGVDEPAHVFSAFHASNMIMGIEDQNRGRTQFDDDWIEGYSYFLMRQCDMDGIAEIDLSFPKQFEFIANGEWLHTKNTELTQCTRATAEWYRYIPSALGITLGRLLHLGFYGTIFLGRLMNTLLYVLIGWFCIRILPVGKLQTIIFTLLPTTLNLCNSYSYDNMSIMFSLLLLSLVLHYSKDEVKVHSWDLYILIGIVVILMPNKIVYALFVLWVLAIPFKKWWRIIVSKKWYEYIGIGGVVAALVWIRYNVGWKYVFIARNYLFYKDASQGIEQDSSRAAYTGQYFLEHFGETVKFAVEGIKKDFWFNIKHCIGCELGLVKLNAPVNIRWTILLLIVIFASYFIAGRGKRVKKQQIIVVILGAFVVLASIFVGCLVRFTPTSGTDHVQISYRYLMPVYMALMIITGNDSKENTNALGLVYIENLTLVFTLTSILTYLFTR